MAYPRSRPGRSQRHCPTKRRDSLLILAETLGIDLAQGVKCQTVISINTGGLLQGRNRLLVGRELDVDQTEVIYSSSWDARRILL